MDSILYENNSFTNYSLEHYISVLIFLLLGIFFIYIGKNKLKSEDSKFNFITLILLFVFLVQIGKIFVKKYIGIFDLTEDLPLHLCNMSPLFLLLAYYFRSRLAWSIFFLWIMSGTFQSLITPTLHQSFPQYEWWRYWIIHAWLVTGAFYGIFVFGYRVKFKDIFYALFWLNVLSFTIMYINTKIGANYMYMLGKPDGETMYNILSEWPDYILQLEPLALAFFLVIYLPFFIVKKLSKKTSN
ncbi:MAG TPA: TIGR02206 family membrane protein [Bacteroidetes bacterium]|nr:TIGR02206 family membrane protein [Bacteroidota bacterium]